MLDLIVTAVQREAPTILAFDLARADGGPLPGFAAGAHLEIALGDGLLRAMPQKYQMEVSVSGVMKSTTTLAALTAAGAS